MPFWLLINVTPPPWLQGRLSAIDGLLDFMRRNVDVCKAKMVQVAGPRWTYMLGGLGDMYV